MAPTVTTTLLGVGVEDVEVTDLDEGFVRVTLGARTEADACAQLIDRSEVLRAVFARVLAGLVALGPSGPLGPDERLLAELLGAATCSDAWAGE